MTRIPYYWEFGPLISLRYFRLGGEGPVVEQGVVSRVASEGPGALCGVSHCQLPCDQPTPPHVAENPDLAAEQTSLERFRDFSIQFLNILGIKDIIPCTENVPKMKFWH